jgi:hypothetical protein
MQTLSVVVRRLCWGVLVAIGLCASLAHAEMIGPEAAIANQAPSQADLDRAKVQQFMDRAGVRDKLRALGVDALHAQDRVDALAPDEVHALAQRIDSLPAGGRLDEMDIILILIVALVVIAIV